PSSHSPLVFFFAFAAFAILKTSHFEMDGTRPGCDRFENVSNGVGPLIAQRAATKSLTAITGTMVKNGHSRTKVLSAAAESRPSFSLSCTAPFLSALTAHSPLSGLQKVNA